MAKKAKDAALLDGKPYRKGRRLSQPEIQAALVGAVLWYESRRSEGGSLGDYGPDRVESNGAEGLLFEHGTGLDYGCMADGVYEDGKWTVTVFEAVGQK